MSHFKLELNRISIYNPHRLDDKELVNGFIVRHKLFDALLSRIGQEKSDSIPQHHLIIGQRGMGKTTLLRRIEVELRNNEAYNKDFIPLSFPEEQYNLDRLSKFWLNCLDALADTLEVQERMDYVQRLDAQIQVLEKIKEETELVDKAFRLFQKMLEELQQRPVLLIDNLNQIFDALEDREHWGLRNQITKKGCPILIGASAAPLEEAYEYGAAFYDSFLFNYLESLSYAEFFKVIRSLAERVENTQLVASLPTKKGRLQALYTLTGGNPRTTVLLFQVFTNGFSVDIYKDLDALLESITPLYKARFEELSTQLQVIVDAIALHWDPCQLATLRTLTRLENHQLSPQLKRLVDMGWITKIKPSKGKGVAYEIGERFFNVWYLMRRSSRRQKRNLISLTRFLEAFYGEKIDEAARHMIEVKSKHLHHVTIKLALSEATRTKSLRSKLQEGAYSELVAFSKKDRSVLSQFDLPDDSRFEAIYEDFKKLEDEGQYLKLEELLLDFLAKYEESASAWNALGHTRQYDLKKMDEVEECYLKAISLNSKYSYPWNNLGDLYKNHLSRYEESERAYLKSIELDPKSAYPWNGLGNLYKNHLSRYEEAEKAYLKSIEVDPKYSSPWNGLGNLYQDHLSRYEESEKAYLKSIELDPQNSHPWNGLGNLYQDHLSRYEESEKAYLKSIEFDSKCFNPWNGLGNLYQDYLSRYEDSEKAYLKSIELDSKHSYPWNGLGNLYKNYFSKYEESEAAYLQAIKLNPVFSYPWNGLGNLYQAYLSKYRESERAYLKAIELDTKNAYPWNGLGNLYQYCLSRYKGSEEAYLKAIEINPKYSSPWNGLGNLYKNYLSRYEESERVYLKSIELDPKSAYPWNGLGNLYQNHLSKHEEAERAYLKAVELDPKFAYAWRNLANLYMDHFQQYEKAERAYREALDIDPQQYAWNKLGNLYQDYLQNYPAAEEAYRKDIELQKEPIAATLNLVFLLRDKMNRLTEAKQLFNSLDQEAVADSLDTYYLLQSLFAFYEENAGTAAAHWQKAIEFVGDQLPTHIQDDWMRSAAVAVRLGYGSKILELMRASGQHLSLRPFYEAVVALEKGDERHFNDIAAEVRPSARILFDFMSRYNK